MCPLTLSLSPSVLWAVMDDCPELSCFLESGFFSKRTTLVQSKGAAQGVFFSL